MVELPFRLFLDLSNPDALLMGFRGLDFSEPLHVVTVSTYKVTRIRVVTVNIVTVRADPPLGFAERRCLAYPAGFEGGTDCFAALTLLQIVVFAAIETEVAFASEDCVEGVSSSGLAIKRNSR